jgi:hypothetical protein
MTFALQVPSCPLFFLLANSSRIMTKSEVKGQWRVLGFETSVFNLFRVRARDLDVSRSRSVSTLTNVRNAEKEICYLSCGGVESWRGGVVFSQGFAQGI